MLQKIIMEFHESKLEGQTPFSNKKLFSKSLNPLSFSKKVLYHKYSKFEYSYSLICTNNLIFNEKCRIVARFKDFLVLDDSTEFLRRFYFKKELKNRLNKIYNFYESYCKIFPNYMILPENQFLYRNIRKKQKMIDAFNEIKKEEEENKKYLRLGLMTKNKEENIIFTEKIQESIDKYHPSVSNILSSTFMSEISNNFNNLNNENESNEKSMVTISLSSYRNLKELNNNNEIFGFDKYFNPKKNSFKDKDKNINNNNTSYSQNSIYSIINILNSDNNMNENEKKTINNNDNNDLNKINNKNYAKFISKINYDKSQKSNTINNKNNNTKSNIKKLLNMNHHNYNHTIKDKNNLNLDLNKIYNHNSIEKKPNQKQDNNTIITTNINSNTNTNIVHNKVKFISHKQAGSVPLASNMLSSNDNNIIKDNKTIKIINNINNIIINDGKNNQIKNGMVININNNYFHLKDTKSLNNKIIKRVKSKEEEKKSKSKGKGIKNNKNDDNKEDIDDKDDELPQFKIFREKRANTNYNSKNNDKKKKEFLLNKIQSPNIKKKSTVNVNNKNLNIENKTKSINPNNYLNINSNNRQNNIYRNSNNFPNEYKKHTKKLIESKTVTNNSNTVNNKNMTEINNNFNLIENKLKISMNKNIKDKPKIEGVDSIDKKSLSINRKIVKNFLTTTKKRKTYQGKFQALENSSLNTFNVNHSKKNDNLNAPSKIEMLNLCNTINTKNNPIKFKLDKKNFLKKTKTNSLQINDNQFLSSFNLTKDKIPCSNNEIDIINIEDNIVKYHKKLIRKSVNHKTQSNSEAELFQDNINKNYFLTNENIKNENDKNKNINDKNNTYNNKTTNNEIRKLNVKEMKEKYHKLLRGNKATHGSYDTTNRFHLYKRFKAVNGIMGNMTNITNSIINNTMTSIKNKRSPLTKKGVLSPSERISNNMTKYINTPIKNMLNMTHKESSIENNNMLSGNKFFLMEKRKKKYDINNKKLKYVKK